MSERKGIDLVRYAVKLLDSCREDVNTRYTSAELLKIADACQRSKWDVYPDEWTERQLRDATKGKVPDWREDPDSGKLIPVYKDLVTFKSA